MENKHALDIDTLGLEGYIVTEVEDALENGSMGYKPEVIEFHKYLKDKYNRTFMYLFGVIEPAGIPDMAITEKSKNDTDLFMEHTKWFGDNYVDKVQDWQDCTPMSRVDLKSAVSLTDKGLLIISDKIYTVQKRV